MRSSICGLVVLALVASACTEAQRRRTRNFVRGAGPPAVDLARAVEIARDYAAAHDVHATDVVETRHKFRGSTSWYEIRLAGSGADAGHAALIDVDADQGHVRRALLATPDGAHQKHAHAGYADEDLPPGS